jgi:hypothetical protein
MPGNSRRFPRFSSGDRLQAAQLNDLAQAVERLEMFGDGLSGLSTGAGTALRFPPAGWKLAVLRLQEPLRRQATAIAEVVQWLDEDWDERGLQKELAGDYYRGHGFRDDLVLAFYHPVAAKWFAVGSGHVLVRGTLDQPLESGGTAELSVTEFDEATQTWVDNLDDIVVREAVGLDEPLPAGTVVFATWHEQAQLWIASLTACPAE